MPPRIVLVCLIVLNIAVPALADSKRIDLRTAAGAAAVKAQWRYLDAKIVEIPAKSEDGKDITTYDIAPHAEKIDFNDADWPIIAPETLASRRGGGRVCFAWYRVNVTLPEGVEGKAVSFVTTVDDYGEVWVDGKLPYKVGQNGGAIVAGFNAPNRVTLPDPKPGKTYQIAIFGINGPISVGPGNRIFLRDTFLEIADK